MSVPLLQVRDLSKHYPAPRTSLFGPRPLVKVLDGVSFDLAEGQTLSLVGESGSGKSTTGRLLLRLLEATRGQVLVDGNDVLALPLQQFLPYRRQLQMIFQDPGASLNPAYTVAQSLEEPLLIHMPQLSSGERRERVAELLGQVGLNTAHGQRLPHEFSGGQRQRIGIARALALSPRLIVADEPVSSLDVSVQSQILNLMQDLKEQHGLSYLFIAHDLAVVRHMSDRVAVMYRGRIVESGSRDQLYSHPGHPYTQLLLASVPRMQVASPAPHVSPSLAASAHGCAFMQRCPRRTALCGDAAPHSVEVEPGHYVACHHP